MKFIAPIIIVIAGILIVFLARNTLALTISPPIKEFTADPGTEFSDVIKLINDEDNEKIFFATIESFRTKGERGEPEFFQTTDETQLSTWITLEQTSVTLKPGEKKEIKYKVSVPEKASTGGHYAAIFWSSQVPEDTGITGVGVVTKIGSLLLVRVSGEIREEMKLIDFSTPSELYNRLPVKFAIGFENNGNIHLKPRGDIKIEPTILGIGKGEVTVNTEEGNVLPKSIRRFESTWQKGTVLESEGKNLVSRFFTELQNEWNNLAIGNFQANLFVLFGQTQPQIIAKTINFWVIPWRVILVGLIVAIFVISILIKGIKAYNRWIIRKAQQKVS